MAKFHGLVEDNKDRPKKSEVFALCKDICSFLVTMGAITGLFFLIAPSSF